MHTDIELRIWSFYETKNSQISGLGLTESDEVHFSAPLSSMKTSLVGSRNEQVYALESDHANCASFGGENDIIMRAYLWDMRDAFLKSEKLSDNAVHKSLQVEK